MVTTGVNLVGCPDLLVCYRGRFIALEVKEPRGRVSKIQNKVLNDISVAGGWAVVVRSVDEALALL